MTQITVGVEGLTYMGKHELMARIAHAQKLLLITGEMGQTRASGECVCVCARAPRERESEGARAW